ncbi:HD domain-containing phosphohydrolase [Miltoncostaea marina]|uniref:HD domain-containing phosphohydrolase n=1 Tax=Miltoncostaea marina TaxID=2843215 RepID=UPI001C3D1458|nr:HD domain-containing phosphohydrolase [Miltoncostaea marina]
MDPLLDLVLPMGTGGVPRLGKRALIALSHAMEDRGVEAGNRPPLIFGGFQRARFFAHDRRRYEQLARWSAVTVVAAGGLSPRGDGPVAAIGVGPSDPFWRDWVLLVYGGGGQAALLVARDDEGDVVEDLPTRDRRCAAGWTYDPRAALRAAWWVADYLRGHDAALAARWTAALAGLPPPDRGADAALTALSGRLVEAMQREIAREQRDARRLEESFTATIHALATAAEARDGATDAHLTRVAEGAVELGRALGMRARELETLRSGARLHDVGRIGVADAVLGKPGRLTDEEMAEMRRHADIGAGIVGEVPGLRPCVPVVRHHHERWDGRGYPDGLAGEDIPLAARVVAVVDAYDAMTSDRPHRRGMDAREALARVAADRGRQFCPRCTDAFLVLMAARGLAPAVPVTA